MNHSTRFLSILALTVSMPLAYAHDPKEHAKEAAAAKAAPDCAAMKDMDHSKMDPKDPVMKAMMAKCSGAMNHDDMKGMDHSKTPASPAAPDAPAHGAHGSH
ncbi:hypothetical protein [Nevskia sp.]|uniref:hypothetical protein n=1 Tax=Nevskia sp. TaxID=1929292 RepID=UPI003F7137B8|nr:hypothetical protein [Gallionella sp.]